jgi:hypothetical protein
VRQNLLYRFAYRLKTDFSFLYLVFSDIKHFPCCTGQNFLGKSKYLEFFDIYQNSLSETTPIHLPGKHAMATKPSNATVPLPMENNEIDCGDMKNQKKIRRPTRSRRPCSDLELYINIKNSEIYHRDTVWITW